MRCKLLQHGLLHLERPFDQIYVDPALSKQREYCAVVPLHHCLGSLLEQVHLVPCHGRLSTGIRARFSAVEWSIAMFAVAVGATRWILRWLAKDRILDIDWEPCSCAEVCAEGRLLFVGYRFVKSRFKSVWIVLAR